MIEDAENMALCESRYRALPSSDIFVNRAHHLVHPFISRHIRQVHSLLDDPPALRTYLDSCYARFTERFNQEYSEDIVAIADFYFGLAQNERLLFPDADSRRCEFLTHVLNSRRRLLGAHNIKTAESLLHLIRYHLKGKDIAQAKSYLQLAELALPGIEFHFSIEHFLRTRKLDKFKNQLRKLKHRLSIIENTDDDYDVSFGSQTSNDCSDSFETEDSEAVYYDSDSDSIDEDDSEDQSIEVEDPDVNDDDEPFPFDELDGLLLLSVCHRNVSNISVSRQTLT